MKKYSINLSMVEDVKAFTTKINKEISSEVLITNDMYVLNAKSILAILSLDLAKPIEVSLLSEDPEELIKFEEIVSSYEEEKLETEK